MAPYICVNRGLIRPGEIKKPADNRWLHVCQRKSPISSLRGIACITNIENVGDGNGKVYST
jgi:hypothetical protein